MKMRSVLFKTITIAAWFSMPPWIIAQTHALFLKHGSYVQEGVPCKDAPFAAMKSWDGIGFSGPHSSRCTTRVLSRHGNQWSVSTACSAIGDGTPNPSDQPYVESPSVTRLSNTRITFS